MFFPWDQLKERDTTVQTKRMLVIFDMLISQFAAGKLTLEHYHHDGLGVFARATSP